MYKILLSEKAAESLKKLDLVNQERITRKIELLKENPKLGAPLTANLAGFWKLRVGDYRLIYEIKNQELIVLIVKLGHRKNIYS